MPQSPAYSHPYALRIPAAAQALHHAQAGVLGEEPADGEDLSDGEEVAGEGGGAWDLTGGIRSLLATAEKQA
jgi:hypothetical protein